MERVLVVTLLALVAACLPVRGRDLPGFSYATTEEALEHWQPQFGSRPVKVDQDADGRPCIVLEAEYTAPQQRACWDWLADLDLTETARIAFDIRSDGTAPAGNVGMYFGTAHGWYTRYWSWAGAGEWTPMVFSLDGWGKEGEPDGWDKVQRFRFSIWNTGTGTATYFLRNFRALDRDPAENYLKNGGFEITGGGMPYAWGSGHWGVGHLPWAADMDLWRRHWHLDQAGPHSGKQCLCLENQPDLPLLKAYSVWLTVKAAQPLTLSAWLRSDRDGLPVTLQCGGKQTTVKVGPAWSQASLPGLPADQRMTIIIAPQEPGTLWLDDVQLQALPEATSEFHAAFTDTAIAAREATVDWSPPRRTPEVAAGRSITGPVTATRSSIDQQGRFLVNGEPYLQHSLGLEFVDEVELVDVVAAAGFHDVCCQIREQVTTARLREILDRCAADGLRCIPWLDGRMTREQFTEHIQTLKDHPALLCWYVYDEPSGERFKEAEARYELARQLDPNHPALINYLSNKLTEQTGDIYSTDIYPIPHSTPLAAINGVRTMRADAPPSHPVWMWLQGTGYAYWMDREPTPRELSCMVYGSLIEGARGIYWFAQIPRTKACFDEMRAMCVEVDALAPFLYSLEPAPEATVDQAGLLVRAYRRQGRVRVLAVNTGLAPLRAKLSLVGATGAADVVFEGRQVSCADGAWSDDFGPYERHVYELAAGG